MLSKYFLHRKIGLIDLLILILDKRLRLLQNDKDNIHRYANRIQWHLKEVLNYSIEVGIPSGRLLPFDFGINTCLTGFDI